MRDRGISTTRWQGFPLALEAAFDGGRVTGWMSVLEQSMRRVQGGQI